MKDIFDFKRFGKYFVSDFKGCVANYGLSLITISMLLYLICYVVTVSFGLIMNQGWEGLGLGTRATLFVIAMITLVITMPVKCYGKITEKQSGSFFLTLPVSRLEKFVSMLLMTIVVAPVIGTALYLGLDALVCLFDKTCGNNLVSEMQDLATIIMNIPEEAAMEAALGEIPENVAKFIKEITCPWLYVDDMIGTSLIFLLGAVFFKKGKTVKTIMACIALAIAASIIATPIMTPWTNEIFDMMDNGNFDEIFNFGIFRHAALFDTLNDTLMNIALLIGIWFRIKTLKH
ncbi:MAG: hypothetical protein IKY95_07215 [Bacteroidales bacterium]|nr:hypothetical protein [Bacteroidales bacterium]